MENSAVVSSAPPFRLTFEDLEQPTYVSLLASEQIYWWNYHSQHAECIIHNPSTFHVCVCIPGLQRGLSNFDINIKYITPC